LKARTTVLIRPVVLVLAIMLGATALVWYRYSPLLPEAWRPWAGGAAALLCVAYMLRLAARMHREDAVLHPPLSWTPQARFDPVDAGAERGTGYRGYTETSSAEGTVQNYLGALPREDARIAACAFACAYLGERMGRAPGDWLDGEGEERAPRYPLLAEEMFGWIAAIHKSYPDNAPPDSTFVHSALSDATKNYAEGRSLALQRAGRALAIRLVVAGLDFDARRGEMDAQRALRDLDGEDTRALLRWGATEGRALAREHGRMPHRQTSA
jgi:hypothetical protein